MEAMTNYTYAEARNLNGNRFQFPFVNRLSELTLSKAHANVWHSHNETEVICCIKGALEYEFRKRHCVTFTSGCFLVIPPKIEHRLIGGIDSPCRRISFFLTEPSSRSHGLAPFSSKEWRNILAEILMKRLKAKAVPDNMVNILVRIADLTAHAELSARDLVELRTLTASALLTFSTIRSDKTQKHQSRLIDEGIEWLKKHHSENIATKQLMSYMGYGHSRLYELFKVRTGLSPTAFLIRYRISKSCELLKTSNLSISTISRRVGFNDPAFFSRIFRRQIGLSPIQYRSKINRHPLP